MRQPKEIEQEIEKLKEELRLSKLEYSKTLIWEESFIQDEESIGFFSISKTKKILTKLWEGEVLLFQHQALGSFKVWMNPQRNRILVEGSYSSSKVQEDTIMDFIVWKAGNWYILNN